MFQGSLWCFYRSIGYKAGGPLLAFFTMLVWGLPVLTLMTLLSFLYQFLDNMNISQDSIRYIGLMAVGFIVVAAVILMQKSGFAINNIIVTRLTIVLLMTRKIPAAFIVLAVLVTGFIV